MRSIIVWAVSGCLDGFANTDCPHITCLRNPAVGREKECEILPAENPETVSIRRRRNRRIGAAIDIEQRGHRRFCAKRATVSRQTSPDGRRSAAQRRDETGSDRNGASGKKLGVEIRLNTPVTPKLIKEIHPHTVINAIGAVPIIPNIPGADLPFVLNLHDVLDGTQTASGNVVGSAAVWSVWKWQNIWQRKAVK